MATFDSPKELTVTLKYYFEKQKDKKTTLKQPWTKRYRKILEIEQK